MAAMSPQPAERLHADDADVLALAVALVGEVEALGVGKAHLVSRLHEGAQLGPRRVLEPQSDRLPKRHVVIMPALPDPVGRH